MSNEIEELEEQKMIKNIYGIENYIVNLNKLIKTENGFEIVEDNDIDKIYGNPRFKSYNELIKRDMHKTKNNDAIALKVLNEDFDIRHYLNRESDLIELMFIIFSFHTKLKKVTNEDVFSKTEIHDVKKIINETQLKIIKEYASKKLFIFLDDNKNNDNFIISPILLELFDIFLEKVQLDKEEGEGIFIKETLNKQEIVSND